MSPRPQQFCSFAMSNNLKSNTSLLRHMIVHELQECHGTDFRLYNLPFTLCGLSNNRAMDNVTVEVKLAPPVGCRGSEGAKRMSK